MRSLRFAPLAVLLAVALVVLLLVFPGRRELIAHVYALVVASILLLALVRVLQATLPPAAPSRFDAALRRGRARAERLPELARIEREVTLGMATAFDLHYRLRPTLRRTASELLAARRGIDLDADREAARKALGEDAWEIVRGDREPPTDRFGPGIELDALRSTVTALEAL
jgi:hypothetical protein